MLIVLPVSPKPLNEVLGPWLAEYVPQNRNMVRFLLPTSGSLSLYDDRNLLITARCALLASEWKQSDSQYEKLHRKYEEGLKTELKTRFDRYALLATWDFQSPRTVLSTRRRTERLELDIPLRWKNTCNENYFAAEDVESFIVKAAARNETMRQVLALLREPPLPGQTAIPYVGDVNIYEQVLRIVAKDKVALNIGGRWYHKEPGESVEDATRRLRQRAWCSGQAMFAVQLGEPSQVGGGGVAVTLPPPAGPTHIPPSSMPQPTPSPGGVTPTIPIGGEPLPPVPGGLSTSQPVIRRSVGAKSGVNLLGDLERWALPDAQKVTQASLTFNGVSVKELRDLCTKLPPKLQAELQLTLPPEGGTTT